MRARVLLASSFVAMMPGVLALHACSSGNLFPPLEDASVDDASSDAETIDANADAGSPTSCGVATGTYMDAAVCESCGANCPAGGGLAQCTPSHATLTGDAATCDTPAVCDCDGGAAPPAKLPGAPDTCWVPPIFNDPDPDSGVPTSYCPGCVVGCAPWQKAVCTIGDPGVPGATQCLHPSLCGCFQK